MHIYKHTNTDINIDKYVYVYTYIYICIYIYAGEEHRWGASPAKNGLGHQFQHGLDKTMLKLQRSYRTSIANKLYFF